jgi:hypothetical protein
MHVCRLHARDSGGTHRGYEEEDERISAILEKSAMSTVGGKSSSTGGKSSSTGGKSSSTGGKSTSTSSYTHTNQASHYTESFAAHKLDAGAGYLTSNGMVNSDAAVAGQVVDGSAQVQEERRVRWVSDVDDNDSDSDTRVKKSQKPLKSTPYPTAAKDVGNGAKVLPKLPMKGTPYPQPGQREEDASSDGEDEESQQSGQTTEESGQMSVNHKSYHGGQRNDPGGASSAYDRENNANRYKLAGKQQDEARTGVISSSVDESKDIDSSERKTTRTALSLRKFRDSAASIRRTAAKVHNRVCMHCVFHVRICAYTPSGVCCVD